MDTHDLGIILALLIPSVIIVGLVLCLTVCLVKKCLRVIRAGTGIETDKNLALARLALGLLVIATFFAVSVFFHRKTLANLYSSEDHSRPLKCAIAFGFLLPVCLQTLLFTPLLNTPKRSQL